MAIGSHSSCDLPPRSVSTTCLRSSVPQMGTRGMSPPGPPSAALLPNPFYPYKRGPAAGWGGLARGLGARGLAGVATEGREPAEQAYIDSLWGPADPAIIRVRGRLDWAGLTALLKGAAVYIGPDTSMTHLAAGSGCPTIALYGPTSPRPIRPS